MARRGDAAEELLIDRAAAAELPSSVSARRPRIDTPRLNVTMRPARSEPTSTSVIGWETPRRYSNDTVSIRTIEGAVSI